MTLDDLNIVLKVAEFKSITAAADSLNMSTATASAAVKRVEKELGIELFIRTTRRLRLSPAGERYIPRCQEGLNVLNIAKQEMLSEIDIVSGELRLSAPSDLGRNIILPWLDEFTDIYPNITLKMHIADKNIDFYRDPVDVAIRYGALSDENLYGFKICNVPRVTCASSGYLAKHGMPVVPDDVAQHNALLYQLYEKVDDEWCFTRDGKTFKVKTSSNKITNDADLVRRWCVAGQGIAKKSCLDMSQDLLNKTVVTILPDYVPTPTELWLVCPSRQTITPAIRLLRDFLIHKCQSVKDELKKEGIL